MGYSDSALRLARPEVVELPRAADRVSFLYFDRVRVSQDRTGVVADWDVEDGSHRQTPVPAAGVAVVVLGLGASITMPAVASLARSGTSLLFTGADGAVAYACASPLTASARWAAAQARVWAEPAARLEGARLLYQRRFPDLDLPDGAPLRVLRGLEGARMKACYREAAARHRFTHWRRETDSTKAPDPVNPLLNLANSILYGVALAACSALGMSPALGLIHEGAVGALLYDLADLYKAEASIPIAFRCARGHYAPAAEVRREMREFIHKHRLLAGMVEVLSDVFGGGLAPAAADQLLDDAGFVPGMHNYGH